MAQHFLLTAAAKTFDLVEIARMTERQAATFFKKLRWPDTNGRPVCPCCGSTERPHDIRKQKRWKCRTCGKFFSVTSGTLFANHKLPLRIYLFAIALYANEAKGTSALKLSRELNVQYKTAFVLLHKLREALLETRDESMMDGVLEMDGAYVNHYVRPQNNINDRVDRRLIANQNPNKRCIVVIRQRHDGDTELVGSRRTITHVLHNENPEHLLQIAGAYIEPGSQIHADEAPGYDDLHAFYDMQRVNHSVEYMSETGACSNQAESFFARFRRMQKGQHHKIGNLYLSNYVNEVAYREDTRRMSNGDIFKDISRRSINSLQSNEWTGYWQDNKRITERLFAA